MRRLAYSVGIVIVWTQLVAAQGVSNFGQFQENTQSAQGMQTKQNAATQMASQNVTDKTTNAVAGPKPGDVDTSFAGGIVSLSSPIYQYNLILGLDHVFTDTILVAGFPTMNKNIQNPASQAVTACVVNSGKGCVVESADIYLAKGQIPNTKAIIYDTVGTSGLVLLGQILDLTPGVMHSHFAYERLGRNAGNYYTVKVVKTVDAGKDALLNAGMFGNYGAIYAVGKVKGVKDWDAAFLAVDGKDTLLCNGGFVAKDFGGNESLDAILMDDQGKIIAAGTRDNKLFLTKINPYTCEFEDYTPGVTALDTSKLPGNAAAIIFDPTGSIIVGGTISKPYGESDIFIRKYLSNAQLESAFGSGGEVILDLGKVDSLTGLALDESGQILLSGAMSTDSDNTDFLVARLEANGKLDKGFGLNKNGVVVIKFPSAVKAIATGIRLDSQKRIVVSGMQYYQGKMGVSVVRLLGGKLKEEVVAAKKTEPEQKETQDIKEAKAEDRGGQANVSIESKNKNENENENRITKSKRVKVAKKSDAAQTRSISEVTSVNTADTRATSEATENTTTAIIAQATTVSPTSVASEAAPVATQNTAATTSTANAETSTTPYQPKESDVVTETKTQPTSETTNDTIIKVVEAAPAQPTSMASAPETIPTATANSADAAVGLPSAETNTTPDKFKESEVVTKVASPSTPTAPNFLPAQSAIPASGVPSIASAAEVTTENIPILTPLLPAGSEPLPEIVKEAIVPPAALVVVGVAPTESLQEGELTVLIAAESIPADAFEFAAAVEKANVQSPLPPQPSDNEQAATPASGTRGGGCALMPRTASSTGGGMVLILLVGLLAIRRHAGAMK